MDSSPIEAPVQFVPQHYAPLAQRACVSSLDNLVSWPVTSYPPLLDGDICQMVPLHEIVELV